MQGLTATLCQHQMNEKQLGCVDINAELNELISFISFKK